MVLRSYWQLFRHDNGVILIRLSLLKHVFQNTDIANR